MDKRIIKSLKEGRKKAGLTQAEAGEKIGIKQTTLSGYENGASEPDLDTLLALFKIYDINGPAILNEVLGSEFSPNAEVIPSHEEKELIKKYRSLDVWERKIVLDLVDGLWRRASAETTKLVPFFPQLASAGVGQIVFDDLPVEQIRIPENSTADFALMIRGDSMEPKFSDGETVLVKRTDKAEPGEIGIFLVNGESYIKEFQQDRLHSLNPDYSDIPFGEGDQIEYFGKVVGKLDEAKN